VSVARFIAAQRTDYRVPHSLTCLLLGVSLAWFYKWLGRARAGPRSTPPSRPGSSTRAGCTARRGCMLTCVRPAGSCRRRRWLTRCGAKAWSRGGSSGAAA